MIKLRAPPYDYRMVLKIHYKGDSEILNYEYERENGNTIEDEFTSAKFEDSSDKDDVNNELVLTLHSSAPIIQGDDEEELVE